MQPTERTCTKCKQVKPLDDFSAAPRGKYGRKASCKTCDAARHASIHPPKPRISRPRREPFDPLSTKPCSICGEVKQLVDFSVSRRGTDTSNTVYRGECKPCASAKAMVWYRANRDRSKEISRRHSLKKLYGLSVAEYDALVRQQYGVCAICGNGRDHKHLHVDHDHDTGNVRGLLCNRCNRAIGLFEDDPAILRKAIAYLVRAKRTHLGGK